MQSHSATWFLPDADATEGWGAALAQCPIWQDLRQIHLLGGLGAGKTTLVRGLLHALGYRGTVRSPTYTLMEPYPLAQRHILHFDLYRLMDPEELEFLGAREMSDAQTLWLVEWPERGAGWLPRPDVRLILTDWDAGRNLELEGPAAADILKQMNTLG